MEERNHTECKKHMMPMKDALDILGGKWKLQIILSLSFNTRRFKEIQRDVTGITAKVLSKELKDLEMNQLVSRTVYDTMPVSVEYTLTPYGKSLEKVMEALYNWGSQHRKRIIGKSA